MQVLCSEFSAMIQISHAGPTKMSPRWFLLFASFVLLTQAQHDNTSEGMFMYGMHMHDKLFAERNFKITVDVIA